MHACMHMYVSCMSIFVYVYTYTHMHACIYVSCMYVWVYIYRERNLGTWFSNPMMIYGLLTPKTFLIFSFPNGLTSFHALLRLLCFILTLSHFRVSASKFEIKSSISASRRQPYIFP